MNSISERLITIHNLHKQFETDGVITKVLNGLDISISKGEFIAIVGPSGSGKSTLMHILGFLDRPTMGEFLFKGQNVLQFDDKKLAALRNREVGFVFQQFNLLPRTTVYDNVKLPLTYAKGVGSEEKNTRTKEAIKAVGIEHRSDNLSNQLSGGEKQRVAIARALVTQPEIIFADEPTGNLDSKSGEQIMQILNKLNEEGKTIILVTHEQYTAEYAARIISLKDGRIVEDKKVTNRHKSGMRK